MQPNIDLGSADSIDYVDGTLKNFAGMGKISQQFEMQENVRHQLTYPVSEMTSANMRS